MYSLKKVKTNKKMSRETNCFSADLCFNDKKVAECFNEGCGGDTEFIFLKKEYEDVFYKFIKKCDPVETSFGKLPMSDDLFIEELLEKIEEEKIIKKLVK